MLVGVSGGPDSMALLFILYRLRSRFQIQMGVAHLNHCLRGESSHREATFVQQTAKKMALPFHMAAARVAKVKRKLGLSMEDAGRRLRYAFFKKIMMDHGYDKLALGHQLDDNAEQVLLALLRGTGPLGLSGIAPVRDNRIIRPLLHIRRAQIEEYVREMRIFVVSDESNEDLTFLRNRIRHRLLPLLAEEYNPQIVPRLAHLADIMRCEQEWIESTVEKSYESIVTENQDGTLSLSVAHLRLAHPALARRLVRMALSRLLGSLREITFAHIQSVLDLVSKDLGKKSCHLPQGIRVHRFANRLVFCKMDGRKTEMTDSSYSRTVPTSIVPFPLPPQISIHPLGIGLRFSCYRPHQLPPWKKVEPNQAHLDWAKISFPLMVRPPAPGDRFTPLGAAGSQKVKKYFIDHRVPKKIRPFIPIITDQQRILWVMGQRMADYGKITEETDMVLSIEFFLLDSR